ncbi:TonB-dependent receptor [Brevundimonas sp. NPDC092305]|uniref:TonB-dependent receptor n=1 Tax=Brevundimonas sp. NPDC092305 TaxID=3363957 RepID=UPI0037FB878F
MNRKRVFWATTALFTGFLAAGAASAQSSGTVATEGATELETVIVTGSRAPANLEGVIVAETVGKTRSSIGQEYIETQTPGQTIMQTLNLVPGLNFVNSDPYGNSGGNIRLRGFDGNRVSITFDGMPTNDTGNYAAYTNQQLDSELIQRASVNQGTTDVDSPTASATGGTINYLSVRPLEEMGAQFVGSLGEFNFKRAFARFDTGAFGPWGTTAWIAASVTDYDKFKGPGSLNKRQINGKIYQDLGGDGNFVSLAGHFNRNRNDSYNNLMTRAQFDAGIYPEQDIGCIRPVGVGGTVQDENTSSQQLRFDGTTGLGSCTNSQTLRINPSDTGNLRGQFSYALTPSLRFTFDPSYQYTLATGGTTFSLLNERDDRLDQNRANNNSATGLSAITNAQCATAAFNTTGVDLNGDGDTCDNVHVYAPSVTNTNRYGISSSLIWDINEDHRVRVAYSLDYGRHRQTGEGSFMTRDARPVDVFSTKGSGDAQPVLGRDGSVYRFRDRASIAELNQFAVEYIGDFFDNALTINLGARAPKFERELNQFCYSQNGSSTVRCTTETPSATLANGNVQFASTGTTVYIPPYSANLSYDDVLPNAGITYRLDGGHSFYLSYAEGLSVPRTDNLYQPVRNTGSTEIDFSTVQPERTKAYDLGYRFRSGAAIAQVAIWHVDFENRIVQSTDNDINSPTFGFSVDRNVGSVKQQGVDAQVGYAFSDAFVVNLSASYNESELQEDLFLNNTTIGGVVYARNLPTKGKTIVETPDWTFGGRIDWDITQDLSLGLQAKYTGDRFATDVNDEVAPSYIVTDMSLRYTLPNVVIRDAYIQLNVNNLFDEQYLGNISTGNNALPTVVNPNPAVPLWTGNFRTYSLGSPRTAQISLGVKF